MLRAKPRPSRLPDLRPKTQAHRLYRTIRAKRFLRHASAEHRAAAPRPEALALVLARDHEP